MAGNPNTLRIVTQAILEKRCLAIRRDGKSRLVTIEPHVVYTDRNKEIILEFYQKSGRREDSSANGFWNSIGWRKIDAVFWLNTFFSPRLDRGFSPSEDKYNTGLVAIVDTGGREDADKRLLQNIETSIEQLLASGPTVQIRH